MLPSRIQKWNADHGSQPFLQDDFKVFAQLIYGNYGCYFDSNIEHYAEKVRYLSTYRNGMLIMELNLFPQDNDYIAHTDFITK